MPLYRTQDLHLELSDEPLLDTSMNMLGLPERGTSLVIARNPLPVDQAFEPVYRQQLDQLRNQLHALIDEPEAVRCGKAGTVQALETRLQLQRGEIVSHQRQLAYVHPQASRLMVLSYSKASPLNDADLLHWQAIKSSLEVI